LLDYIDKTEVINADTADDTEFIGISKQVCCQSVVIRAVANCK